MWKISYSDVEPAAVDSSISEKFVYLRRNIQKVTVDEFGYPYEMWQYEERKLTKDEYRISQLEDENTNLQLALTELYEKVI